MRLMLPLLALISMLASAPAAADVDVNINIGLPVLAVAADPFMAVISGTYVYFCTDVDADLFFFQGYWWRLHKGRWHRSAVAGGPWVFFRTVPHPLLNLPPGWRKLPPGHAKFKAAEMKKNWKQWEKDKKWDKKAGPAPAGGPAKQELRPQPAKAKVKDAGTKPAKGGKGKK